MDSDGSGGHEDQEDANLINLPFVNSEYNSLTNLPSVDSEYENLIKFPFVNSEYNNLKNLSIVDSEYNHNKIPPLLFQKKNISLLALSYQRLFLQVGFFKIW